MRLSALMKHAVIEHQDPGFETLDGITVSSTHLKRVKVLHQGTFATQRTLEADADVSVSVVRNQEVNPHRLLLWRGIVSQDFPTLTLDSIGEVRCLAILVSLPASKVGVPWSLEP